MFSMQLVQRDSELLCSVDFLCHLVVRKCTLSRLLKCRLDKSFRCLELTNECHFHFLSVSLCNVQHLYFLNVCVRWRTCLRVWRTSRQSWSSGRRRCSSSACSWSSTPESTRPKRSSCRTPSLNYRCVFGCVCVRTCQED